jgi:MFS family permease
VIVTVWMLAGLSLGLAPTIVRSVFLLESGLLNGICGFIAPAASAVFGVIIARRAARVAMLIGIYASMVGAVVIVTGVLQQTLSIMILGQIIAGVGFGAAFSATLRLIMPLVATHERAAVATGVYLVAYVAFGLPVVIAGLLAAPVGLLPTISGYGATACILAFIGLSAQVRISRKTRG